MGIYLFGELIISQQAKQRALVDEVLQEIGAEMDQCTYQTVKDMLEGKEWKDQEYNFLRGFQVNILHNFTSNTTSQRRRFQGSPARG